jgi:hypothetical protein
MKNISTIILIFIIQTTAFSQTKVASESFTFAEFKAGYGNSIFGSGLKEKFEAGHFSSSGGWLASLAAYHKFKKINNLNFGIKYKSLAAEASRGDNDQEMFFNYWGAAVTIKYFPFDKNARKGLYLQGDYFFVSQFTQKYTQKSTLAYIPQYGIGSGFVFGTGYDIPLKGKKSMITIGLEYETNTRNGQVAGVVAETILKSANYGAMIGIKF